MGAWVECTDPVGKKHLVNLDAAYMMTDGPFGTTIRIAGVEVLAVRESVDLLLAEAEEKKNLANAPRH